MPTVSPSQSNAGDLITAAAINNPVNQLAAVVNGGIDATNLADGAITTAKLASASVSSAKVNFGGSGAGIWWEEVGRTTLTTAGNLLSVSFAARKYLKVIVLLVPTGGTIDGGVRFNNDSGTNYAFAGNTNGTTGAAGSLSSLPVPAGASANPRTFYIDITNSSIAEKTVNSVSIEQSGTGGASAPGYRQGYMKWASNAQVTSIQVTNGGTGTFAIGSEIIVIGHD